MANSSQQQANITRDFGEIDDLMVITIFKRMTAGLLYLASAVFNGLLIAVLLRCTRRPVGASVLVCGLAVTALLLSLLNFILVLDVLPDSWVTCHRIDRGDGTGILDATQMLLENCLSLLLLCLGVMRYYVIRRSRQTSLHLSSKHGLIGIACCFTLSLLVMVCCEQSSVSDIDKAVRLTGWFLILALPQVVNLILQILIFGQIRRLLKQSSQTLATQHQKYNNARASVRKMMIYILLIVLPYVVISLLVILFRNRLLCMLKFVLLALSCFVLPISLGLFKKENRHRVVLWFRNASHCICFTRRENRIVPEDLPHCEAKTYPRVRAMSLDAWQGAKRKMSRAVSRYIFSRSSTRSPSCACTNDDRKNSKESTVFTLTRALSCESIFIGRSHNSFSRRVKSGENNLETHPIKDKITLIVCPSQQTIMVSESRPSNKQRESRRPRSCHQAQETKKCCPLLEDRLPVTSHFFNDGIPVSVEQCSDIPSVEQCPNIPEYSPSRISSISINRDRLSNTSAGRSSGSSYYGLRRSLVPSTESRSSSRLTTGNPRSRSFTSIDGRSSISATLPFSSVSTVFDPSVAWFSVLTPTAQEQATHAVHGHSRNSSQSSLHCYRPSPVARLSGSQFSSASIILDPHFVLSTSPDDQWRRKETQSQLSRYSRISSFTDIASIDTDPLKGDTAEDTHLDPIIF